jgi:hypothetical protein
METAKALMQGIDGSDLHLATSMLSLSSGTPTLAKTPTVRTAF